MEIKATLQKPFTEAQRIAFIQEQNRTYNYDIVETEEALEAWGFTSEEQAQQEAQRIAQLSLTKREVFLALYRDKGITPEQLKAQIQDPEALIEFEYAAEYFRGNPLINQIGQMLGYTSADLDYLFMNKELPTT